MPFLLTLIRWLSITRERIEKTEGESSLSLQQLLWTAAPVATAKRSNIDDLRTWEVTILVVEAQMSSPGSKKPQMRFLICCGSPPDPRCS